MLLDFEGEGFKLGVRSDFIHARRKLFETTFRLEWYDEGNEKFWLFRLLVVLFGNVGGDGWL